MKIPLNVPISIYIWTYVGICYMISRFIVRDVLVFRGILLGMNCRFFGKSDNPLGYPCLVKDVQKDILYNILYNIPMQYTIGYHMENKGFPVVYPNIIFMHGHHV